MLPPVIGSANGSGYATLSPAKAGIQGLLMEAGTMNWVPAYAGISGI
jgi:hypothetical protein